MLRAKKSLECLNHAPWDDMSKKPLEEADSKGSPDSVIINHYCTQCRIYVQIKYNDQLINIALCLNKFDVYTS